MPELSQLVRRHAGHVPQGHVQPFNAPPGRNDSQPLTDNPGVANGVVRRAAEMPESLKVSVVHANYATQLTRA